MRKLVMAIMMLLLLAYGTTVIGCSGEGEATTPEGKEVERFLNDKHVKSVLWEEWNIFDEYLLALANYEASGRPLPWQTTFFNQRASLLDRAEKNYQAFIGITPPTILENQWGRFIEALALFYQNMDNYTPYGQFLFEKAPSKNIEAWLELRRVCNQHGVSMEWPLPRSP
jgi:hypothetical protein